MKRLSKFSVLLIAVALVSPALAHSADSYDEQHLASPAPAKNFQGYLLQDSAEITRFNSGLISFKVDGLQKVESITACSSLSQVGCEFTAKQFYRAVLPKCDATNTVDCITKVFAKTDEGKELEIQPAGIFADKGKYDFQGDPSQNLPTGGGAILVKIPEAPHAGGDLYLIKSEMVGVREIKNSPTAKFLMQRMQTGIFAVSIETGKFGFSSMSVDPKQYPSADWTIGAPVGQVPEAGKCVMSSETECAKGYPLPQNVAFGLQFRMNNQLNGWLHGRMKAPSITLVKETAGTQLLTVQANAIKVPLIDVWVNNDQMPADLKNYYAGVPNYGSASFGTKEQPLSEIALRRDGNSTNDANTMKEFVNWLPVIGDKAQGMPTAWMLKTMISFSDSNNENSCFANNYYICCAMHNIGQTVFPNTVLKAKSNDFVDYNFSIILETEPTHGKDKKPPLKSKLLFMDYRFHKMLVSKLYFTDKRIIKFGRKGYEVNDVQVPGGTAISRRHCLIVNCKDDVWLYDLGSTGTYVNDEKVNDKVPLIGLNTIKIDKAEYKITTDQNKLL